MKPSMGSNSPVLITGEAFASKFDQPHLQCHLAARRIESHIPLVKMPRACPLSTLVRRLRRQGWRQTV